MPGMWEINQEMVLKGGEVNKCGADVRGCRRSKGGVGRLIGWT